MSPEVEHIAVTLADGTLATLQIIVRAPLNSFSTDAALASGFVLSEDGEFWEGGATDFGVEYYISLQPYAGGRLSDAAASWRRIKAADIPADRSFRAAWVDDCGIKVDMPKARDIHRSRLRVARGPALAALDADYLRADEAGDVAAKVAIASRKQALRDLPNLPSINKAKTPAALSAIWPEELPR